jgi:hypothetical protein
MDLSERTTAIIAAVEPNATFLPEVSAATKEGLLDLYTEMSRAFASLARLHRRDAIKASIRAVEPPSGTSVHGLSTRWVPPEVIAHVEENVSHVLSYSATIGGRSVVIEFGMTEDQLGSLEEYDGHVDFILMWLMVCAAYSAAACARTLTVRLYLTPFPKLAPSSKAAVLGPRSVNTGYTRRCEPEGEIVIYRDEEWRKVLIHEAFHAYGLDFSHQPAELSRRMERLFHVHSHYNMAEAYTETWARLCNSAVVAYTSAPRRPSKANYLRNAVFNIGIERMFACIQCEKVLGHMGLKYRSLIGNTLTDEMLRENLYRENTNVLAYYVVTAVLLGDYPGFIGWCRHNNTSLLRFRATQGAFSSFATLTERSARSNEFAELMRAMEGSEIAGQQASLAMSAVEGAPDMEN